MRAVVSERIGGPESLVLATRTAQASLGEGEVRIAVKAVGLNYPDLLIIEDKYQFKPERPFSPGSELAGIVTEVGAGVSSFVPGDRVSATTLWGALAEEVIATETDCVPLPDSIDFVTAAALPERIVRHDRYRSHQTTYSRDFPARTEWRGADSSAIPNRDRKGGRDRGLRNRPHSPVSPGNGHISGACVFRVGPKTGRTQNV